MLVSRQRFYSLWVSISHQQDESGPALMLPGAAGGVHREPDLVMLF
jgi:hypothetical protein